MLGGGIKGLRGCGRYSSVQYLTRTIFILKCTLIFIPRSLEVMDTLGLVKSNVENITLVFVVIKLVSRDVSSATNVMKTQHQVVCVVDVRHVEPAHRYLDPVLSLDVRIGDAGCDPSTTRHRVDEPEAARLDPGRHVPNKLPRRLVRVCFGVAMVRA